MRGRFTVLCMALNAFLGGCAPLHVADRPPAAALPAAMGGAVILRIAQTPPVAAGLTSTPSFMLCGGRVRCPEPTRKTLDTAMLSAVPGFSVLTPEPVTKKALRTRTVAIPIRFGFASARLTPKDLTPLQAVIENLRAAERITLRGRTDAVGGKQDNDSLAQQRAEAVREYLIGYGFNAERIGIEAEGKCCYTASNSTSVGRAVNRRVEVNFIMTIETHIKTQGEHL